MLQSRSAGADTSEEELIGATLGHFEVLELLGRGGQGTVYRARDILLDRPVALKVLPTERVCLPEQRRALLEEARAAARVGCPEVAAIYEVHLDDRTPYVAMELVEGQTLRALLKEAPLHPERAVDLALQIARALAWMHARGVLHRDLKPENVMVDARGRIKVLDFGLARAIGLASEARTPSVEELASAALGTRGYAAPEQLDGRLVDARADVFALGAILFELLTGEPAMGREGRGAMSASVVTAPPRQRLPPDLRHLIQRCLAPERERRPPDGEALLRALSERGARAPRVASEDRLPACPPPLPPGAPDARALFVEALRAARHQDAGFLGLEHVGLALRETAGGGPLTLRVRAALSGGEEIWTPCARVEEGSAEALPLTPRLTWWADFLDARFDLEELCALLCADPDHHLHLLARQDLGARPEPGSDRWATLTGLSFASSRAESPTLALEVLRGPEDGRVLTMKPGDRLGRWSPEGALEHALYVGSAVTDPALSRHALSWSGEGRVNLRRPGRLVRAGERFAAPPGELQIHPGDVLQLTPGTWLRALDRDHLDLRTVHQHRTRPEDWGR